MFLENGDDGDDGDDDDEEERKCVFNFEQRGSKNIAHVAIELNGIQ